MYQSIPLKQILFIDIETVPLYEIYSEAPARYKEFWEKKSNQFRGDESPETVYARAGIFAEFGKIVCISVGIVAGEAKNLGFKLKSFAGENEVDILSSFIDLLVRMEKKHPVYLCAHNGKEFDYPYLSRRLLINALPLPETLNNGGKKPWEIKHLDTLELWKFGDYKHYTSLDLLTYVFNIDSPKAEIDGSQVARVFYIEKDIEKIKRYCENDVIALMQIMMRYQGRPLIAPEFIQRSNIEVIEGNSAHPE